MKEPSHIRAHNTAQHCSTSPGRIADQAWVSCSVPNGQQRVYNGSGHIFKVLTARVDSPSQLLVSIY